MFINTPPLKGGTYIDLPLKYKNSSKGLLNIVNKMIINVLCGVI